jgi:hypothetical protein
VTSKRARASSGLSASNFEHSATSSEAIAATNLRKPVSELAIPSPPVFDGVQYDQPAIATNS